VFGGGPVLYGPARRKLCLYQREGLLVYDRRVVFVDVVLRDFSFVLLFLFCKEIRCIYLLEQCVALVLFIGQDAPYAACAPFLLAAGRGDSVFQSVIYF